MSGHPAIHQSIAQSAEALTKLALDIHANPELGFAEHKALAWQTKLLRRWRFNVQAPFVGLDTAYKATIGRGKPTVCYMAEYDALPEIGHGCGHNLISAVALGAGRALTAALRKDKLPGTVVIMGTPAEETDGGKVRMVERGAMKGIDVALMAHPSIRTIPWNGSTAVQSYDVTFEGKSAHAAAGPEKGKNALDAARLLFAGVDAWRQHLEESSRIHGIITDGGAAPNIIPERASCFFFIRSPDDGVLAAMVKRFKSIAAGAAMMTETKAIVRAQGPGYKAPWLSRPLNDAYVAAAKAAGLRPVTDPGPGRGSTDFSDVSQVVPGTHVYFGIGRGKKLASHSPAFTAAAATPHALKQMLRAAEALANMGYRYVTDEDFRSDVTEAYRRQAKQA